MNVNLSHLPNSEPQILFVVGETASGKSAFAIELALKYGGEIVCADSLTVYKGFDIGTAKPTKVERAAIPHHLLDVTTADKGFAAPEFKRLAEEAIRDIKSRGNLPIVVGGSGLYIDSLLYDYKFLEKSDPEVRSKLNQMRLSELINLAESNRLDLNGIDRRNKRRVIRLIENNGKLPDKLGLRSGAKVLGVKVSRETLQDRIKKRVDAMLDAGLEKEVKQLADIYGWDNEPMKSIGYREWKEYFDGTDKLEKTRERIIAGTRRLAKKQRTWFGRNTDIYWLGVDEDVLAFLENTPMEKIKTGQKSSKNTEK